MKIKLATAQKAIEVKVTKEAFGMEVPTFFLQENKCLGQGGEIIESMHAYPKLYSAELNRVIHADRFHLKIL